MPIKRKETAEKRARQLLRYKEAGGEVYDEVLALAEQIYSDTTTYEKDEQEIGKNWEQKGTLQNACKELVDYWNTDKEDKEKVDWNNITGAMDVDQLETSSEDEGDQVKKEQVDGVPDSKGTDGQAAGDVPDLNANSQAKGVASDPKADGQKGGASDLNATEQAAAELKKAQLDEEKAAAERKKAAAEEEEAAKRVKLAEKKLQAAEEKEKAAAQRDALKQAAAEKVTKARQDLSNSFPKLWALLPKGLDSLKDIENGLQEAEPGSLFVVCAYAEWLLRHGLEEKKDWESLEGKMKTFTRLYETSSKDFLNSDCWGDDALCRVLDTIFKDMPSIQQEGNEQGEEQRSHGFRFLSVDVSPPPEDSQPSKKYEDRLQENDREYELKELLKKAPFIQGEGPDQMAVLEETQNKFFIRGYDPLARTPLSEDKALDAEALYVAVGGRAMVTMLPPAPGFQRNRLVLLPCKQYSTEKKTFMGKPNPGLRVNAIRSEDLKGWNHANTAWLGAPFLASTTPRSPQEKGWLFEHNETLPIILVIVYNIVENKFASVSKTVLLEHFGQGEDTKRRMYRVMRAAGQPVPLKMAAGEEA
jgi:hypothetical protein